MFFQESEIFWSEVLEDVKLKFPTVPPAFTRKESEAAMKEGARQITLEDVHRVRSVNLILRVLDLVGVKLSGESKEELRGRPESFQLVPSDIEEVKARVRHITTIDYSEGMSLALTAKKAAGKERLRLLRLASSKFSAALSSSPSSYLSLFQWGSVLLEQSELVSQNQVRYSPILCWYNSFLMDIRFRPSRS